MQADITHHDVCLSLGITQVWVQPIHELLHLLPVQEDDKHQEQEVEDTQTLTAETHDIQDMRSKPKRFSPSESFTHQKPSAILPDVV